MAADEYAKDEKIDTGVPTALSRVIEAAIVKVPYERRLYPDLYAVAVADEVKKFFSEQIEQMASDWEEYADNAEWSAGATENDRLLDYAATQRRRAAEIRGLVAQC